jgi:5-methylcytosine-specific restriction endonuclease McrA
MRRPGLKLSVPVFREIVGSFRDQPCYLCGDPMTSSDASLDHVMPLARGGASSPENVRWAHTLCNRLKSELTLDELVALAGKISALHGGRS